MEMNAKTLATGAISLIIMVCLFSAILVPIVDDAASGIGTTYSNDGSNVALYTDVSDLSYDIIYDVSNHSISGLASSSGTVVLVTDMFTITMGQNSASLFGTYHTAEGDQYYARTITQGEITQLEIAVVGEDLTVTITGGTPSTITETISWLAVSDDSGQYRYLDSKWNPKTYNVTGVDQIYMVEYSGGSYYVLSGSEATYNGAPASVYYEPEPVTGTVNIESVTSGANGTVGITAGETNHTEGYFIVPASVQGYTNVSDSAVFSIISVIPLLVLVGIVIVVVRSYLTRD